MREKHLTAKDLRKLINDLPPGEKVFIFVAFLEDHAQITRKEANALIDTFPGRTWEVASEDFGLFIEA